MCDHHGSLIYDGAKGLGLSHEQFCDFLELFLEVSRKDINLMRHAMTVGDRIGAVTCGSHSVATRLCEHADAIGGVLGRGALVFCLGVCTHALASAGRVRVQGEGSRERDGYPHRR